MKIYVVIRVDEHDILYVDSVGNEVSAGLKEEREVILVTTDASRAHDAFDTPTGFRRILEVWEDEERTEQKESYK
ncbi:hypothetical protein EF808_00755 [archaeon]|nr:MAG: hypothetical protein EF808_00755 [archaeon]